MADDQQEGLAPVKRQAKGGAQRAATGGAGWSGASSTSQGTFADGDTRRRIALWRREFQSLTGVDPADGAGVAAWQLAHGLPPSRVIRSEVIERARAVSSQASRSGVAPGAALPPTSLRIRAEPEVKVAVPATRVTYRVGMDAAEISHPDDYRTYRWECRNDPAARSTNLFFVPRVAGPEGKGQASWEVTWGFPGTHTLICQVTTHRQGQPPSPPETLRYEQTVRPLGAVADEALEATRALDLGELRARLEIRKLAAAEGGSREQLSAISSDGPNPAVPARAPGFGYQHYRVRPAPTAKAWRWYVRGSGLAGMPEDFHGYRRTSLRGEPVYDLGTAAEARRIIAQPNVYTIVCEQLDGAGQPVAPPSQYRQVVLDEERGEEVRAWGREVEVIDAHAGKIADGEARPLRAALVAEESGARVPLSLYLGPDAGNPKRLKLVDLLPGVKRREYGGTDAEQALRDFLDGNAYPAGLIEVELPALAGAPPRRLTLRTRGESAWASWSGHLGLASLGLMAGGLVAAAAGAEPLAYVLFVTAAAGGAASAGLDLFDAAHEVDVGAARVALDVFTIASSLVGGASATRSLVGALRGKPVRVQQRTFVALERFTSGASLGAGMVITTEGVVAIEEVLRDDRSTRDRKIAAIVRILSGLALQGGLMALAIRDHARAAGRGVDPLVDKSVPYGDRSEIRGDAGGPRRAPGATCEPRSSIPRTCNTAPRSASATSRSRSCPRRWSRCRGSCSAR